MNFTTMKKTAGGLSLAGLLLLLASAIAYQSARGSLESSFWVAHTEHVLDQLQETEADLAQAKIATEEYLLTGNEIFLQQHKEQDSSLDTDLTNLLHLITDNPAELEKLSTLRSQVNDFSKILDLGITLRQTKGFEAARQFVLRGREKAAMDDAFRTLQSMDEEEDALLTARQARLNQSVRRATAAFGLTLGLELLLLGLLYYAIRKEFINREKTERALRLSEERFRRLVSGVTDYAIYQLTFTGEVASWNEGAERIKGYTEKQIIGQHFSCFFTPEDLASGKSGQELDAAVVDGHYQEEGWRVRKDGTRFWASVVITALKDEAGTLVGFSKITRDNTERKRADELLLESEDKHRQLFENNPHPTWVYDRETLKFLAVNAAAVRKYGYSNDEFLNMTITDIRLSEDIPAVLASVERIKAVTSKATVGEWKHCLKDGSIIDVETTSFPLNFGGRPAQLVVAVDETQRKRDEEAKRNFIEALDQSNKELELRNREAEHATKLKSKFLANMSHELRTPLNAIVGFSGLLADGTAGLLNEKQQRFITHIKNGSHHLLQLINDILDLSKIEAGQLEIHCEPFQIADALPELLSTVRPLAMAKNIEVEHGSGTARVVFADRVRFKQILYNLLSNAVKIHSRERACDGRLGGTGRFHLRLRYRYRHRNSERRPGIHF